MSGFFSLVSDSLPGGTVLVGFRGRDRLSQTYLFELFVTVPGDADVEDMVGKPLALLMGRELERTVAGIVQGVELLEEKADRSLALLTLVPRLELLALSRHSRVFAGESLPQIFEKILKSAGFSEQDYDLRLNGDYPPLAHVCQYRESDLAFLSRWMEHEGIHYFFEHAEGGEKLVVSDQQPSAALGSGRARFEADGGEDASSGDDVLFSFRTRHGARPKKLRLQDYDYERPQLNVFGEADVFSGGHAEMVFHAEDRFVEPARGKALAAVRAQEIMASQAVQRGSGRHFNLQPGFVFELEGHFVDKLDKSYLCTAAFHEGVSAANTAEIARMTGLPVGESYRVEIEAIDASLRYRPSRVTPWPRVHGLEVAVVDGAADSDYAQIDDMGRYHVRFAFDENDHEDGKASTVLRMMQPHEGNPEGMHFPLRKGTEVMVAFLGGDPDRPLITAAVPNALNPSPVTSANNTRNVIHTGGNNRVEMEDQDGGEWIHINTPTENTHLHLGKPHEPASHHLELKTDGTGLFNFGSNQDIFVGGKLTEDVAGAVKETYSSSQQSTITGPKQTTVTQGGCVETYGSTQLTMVTKDVTENYNAGQDTTVNAAKRTEFFTAGQDTTVNAAVTEQAFYGLHIRTVDSAAKNTFTGSYTRHVTGSAYFKYPAVNRLWGPSEREFKSLDWKVPTLTIVCGSENLSHHKGVWNSMAETHYEYFKLYAGFLTMLYGGAKIQPFGAWLSIVRNYKFEVFAGGFLNMMGAISGAHATHHEFWFGVKNWFGGLSSHG